MLEIWEVSLFFRAERAKFKYRKVKSKDMIPFLIRHLLFSYSFYSHSMVLGGLELIS